MAHLTVKKGLDIPIQGKPLGGVQELPSPSRLSLNFDSFPHLKARVLVRVGDFVKIGQPLVEDKAVPGRLIISPAAGKILEVQRGVKRSLKNVIIEKDAVEDFIEHSPLNVRSSSPDQILKRLLQAGLFAHIRMRPFNIRAHFDYPPKSIFVKAVESAPFVPPAEMQVEGHEKEFQEGLNALAMLTEGAVHLVYHRESTCKAFTEASNVEKHTVFGPHPVANPSVHIHHFDPIVSVQDVRWTLNAHDVVAIGFLLTKGRYFIDRIVSIAGTGIIAEKRGYFRTRMGAPIDELLRGRVESGQQRLISGDVLTGTKVTMEDFLHFNHYSVTAIPEQVDRELFHFIRSGLNKFSSHRAYLSGHVKPGIKKYIFTTGQHGENRFFVDNAVYDQVMPMRIPTVPLAKAVLARDWELAEELGLLEVDVEDFALPTFVCPSKVNIGKIISVGLDRLIEESFN